MIGRTRPTCFRPEAPLCCVLRTNPRDNFFEVSILDVPKVARMEVTILGGKTWQSTPDDDRDGLATRLRITAFTPQ